MYNAFSLSLMYYMLFGLLFYDLPLFQAFSSFFVLSLVPLENKVKPNSISNS